MAPVVATLVVAAAIVTFAAVYTHRHAPASRSVATPPTAPAQRSAPPPQGAPVDLAAEFAQLAARLNATMGLAVSAVGADQHVTTWGDWPQGPAWSTIKVPLVIAAYRQQNKVTDKMTAAITESDNAAAESLWGQLGDPSAAAQQVQRILQEYGDPTVVESRKLRPEFTAFGQTVWSLTNQVQFTANAFCDQRNDPILELMSRINAQQSWGVGRIPGARFKGGWGPSPSGRHLVRQLGVLDSPRGKVAVAVAAEPASGSFDDGTRALDEVATWLQTHLADLPAGRCNGNT